MQYLSQYFLNPKMSLALASEWPSSDGSTIFDTVKYGWFGSQFLHLWDLNQIRSQRISGLFVFWLFLFWVDVRRLKKESEIIFRKISHLNHFRTLLCNLFFLSAFLYANVFIPLIFIISYLLKTFTWVLLVPQLINSIWISYFRLLIFPWYTFLAI